MLHKYLKQWFCAMTDYPHLHTEHAASKFVTGRLVCFRKFDWMKLNHIDSIQQGDLAAIKVITSHYE